jgi:hypothetical protein
MINKYIKYALAVIISVLGFSYTAQAAGRNGDGIVYHYSDCGQDGDQYNVRFYGFGGDGPGSACEFGLKTIIGPVGSSSTGALGQMPLRNVNNGHQAPIKVTAKGQLSMPAFVMHGVLITITSCWITVIRGGLGMPIG